MRKLLLAVAVAMVVALVTFELEAGSLAGVSLPDSQQVAGKTLALNGLGLRTKFMVKVYVAGLYLEQKSSDANHQGRRAKADRSAVCAQRQQEPDDGRVHGVVQRQHA